MKLLKGIGTGLCLSLLCLLVTAKAKADEQNSKTVVTLSAPLAVPGLGAQTLPAGTYIFKVLDSSSDRDIIQISSQDGTHVFATILGVPNSRLKASDSPVTMFEARPSGEPQALKAWFGSGRTSGDQIVYRKPMATQLAKEANEPVLSTTTDMANSSVDTLKAASIGAISASGEAVSEDQVVDSPTAAAPAMAVAATTPATSNDATVAATTPASSTDSADNATTPATSNDSTVNATTPATSNDSTVAATTPATSNDSTVNATTPATSNDSTVNATTPATSNDSTVAATTPATSNDSTVAATTPATSNDSTVAATTPATSNDSADSATTPATSNDSTVNATTDGTTPADSQMATTESATASTPADSAEPSAPAAQEAAQGTLPKTASLLPLIGLGGLLTLGAAFLLTGLLKRNA